MLAYYLFFFALNISQQTNNDDDDDDEIECEDLEWSADVVVVAVEGGQLKLMKSGVNVERQTVHGL